MSGHSRTQTVAGSHWGVLDAQFLKEPTPSSRTLVAASKAHENVTLRGLRDKRRNTSIEVTAHCPRGASTKDGEF